MKKLMSMCVLIVLSIALVACGSNTTQSGETEQKQEVKKLETASDYVNALKEKGLAIGEVVVYDSATDPNQLLGRPNQYTSKVNFVDTRLEQMTDENGEVMKDENGLPDVTGGTIEVFANEKDMNTRKEYIESVTEGMEGMVGQYMYTKDNVLFRLEFDLTPEQAKEYEDAFNEL